jgi:hypothetical protein
MTEHLYGFVARLHAQGHPPQKIYDALITRIPAKYARELIHKVTGCVIAKRAEPPARTRGERARQVRRKISAACKGKTRTQETRDRISAAVKQRWADLAASTPTKVCAREGCEAIVAKETMRYCSKCQEIARREQQAKSNRLARERRQRIKRYTGHHFT